MEGLIRNREVKDILLRLMLLQILLLIGLLIFQAVSLNNIKNGVVRSQGAMVGGILKNHPELEEEIIPYVTKGVSNNEINEGLKTLSFYGYGTKMFFSSEIIVSKNSIYITSILMAVFIIHTMLLIFITLKGYDKIFIRIRDITLSLQEILKGNFSRHIPEGDEGDFSILGHHFNCMSRMLNQNLEVLRNERTFLKDILSDISHQLKTPMSSLMMLNDLLLEAKNMEKATREDFLNKTKVQLNRMNWLIKSLLKIARLEAKAIEFKREEIPLKKVVEGAIDTIKIPAELKNISINVVDNKEAAFLGDGDWTKEALLNIIKNCVEHTSSGGKIEIELSATPISSTIIIRDNGEGISKEDLPNIFKRFYKGSNSTKDDSIGIGLAMSKSIVEGQGGEIRVKSEKGIGSEFNITFLRGVI